MNKIFMKYWINDDLFIRNLLIKIGGTTANVSEFKKKSKALNYELMIYKDIIRHLVDENICTNFIRCLGSSSACDADNILSIIKKNKSITPARATSNFLRNLAFMLDNEDNRPSVTSVQGNIPIVDKTLKDNFKKFSFGFIISEYRTGITFSDWYTANRQGITTNDTFYKLLFQVCCGCYAMHLSKVVHNDLHLGNVRLATDLTPEESIFYYETDAAPNLEIKFECGEKAMIYDFDRGYSTVLGINNLVSNDCDAFAQCNSTREGFDFTYFIINLILHEIRRSPNGVGLNFELLSYLLLLISKNTTEFNKILSILLIHVDSSKKIIIQDSNFSMHPVYCMGFKYRSYKSMLNQLTKKLKIDPNLPYAEINTNTILSHQFDKTSGQIINLDNVKDCL
jgi:hypothetical protein